MFILIGGTPFKSAPLVNEFIVSKLQPIKDSGRKPYVLYMPQACYESKPSVNSFSKEFGARLKCKTSAALWSYGENSYERIVEKFSLADMIYIGGGRFDLLLNEFNKMNIKPLLARAAADGKIIVGNSAGAMLLSKTAISDYMIVSGQSSNHCLVNGYGLVDITLCPHAEDPSRRKFIDDNYLQGITLINSDEYKIFE